MTSPIIISVEGSVGAGKSTLLEKLQQQGHIVVPEPVEAWINFEGVNPLEMLYQNPLRWSFTFQIHVLQTRIKALCDALALHPGASVIFVERSVQADYQVFVEYALEIGNITPMEAAIHKELHKMIQAYVPSTDAHVYLDVSPEECLRRTKQRGRDGEEAIQDSMYHALKNKHDTWLNQTSVPTLTVCDNDTLSVSRILSFATSITNKR